MTLVAHEAGDDTAQKLALRKEIALIDFTGSTANGEWLERNAHQAHVFAEKAGVNAIVVDSTSDFKGLARNVAFSLSLYTGQMCTAPQNIFVPRAGIDTPEGHLSFDQVGYVFHMKKIPGAFAVHARALTMQPMEETTAFQPRW